MHESKTDGVPAVFSLYLSKDDYYYGKFVLGGYDLKYAAAGLGAQDIFWADMHTNHNYWVASMGAIKF